MRCPVCFHWIEDDDYWQGSMCLSCALKADDAKKKLEALVSWPQSVAL